MNRYHCFWTAPYGQRQRYEAFDALEPVLDLVRRDYVSEAQLDEPSNVRGLRVVYGELLEFEPVEVVKTFRVKEPKEPKA